MEQFYEACSTIKQKIESGAPMCPSKLYPIMIFKCGLLFGKIPDIQKVFPFVQYLSYLRAQLKITQTIEGQLLSYLYENPQFYDKLSEIVDRLLEGKAVNILMEIQKLQSTKQLVEEEQKRQRKPNGQIKHNQSVQANNLVHTATVKLDEQQKNNNKQEDNISQHTQKYDQQYFANVQKMNQENEAYARKLQQQEQRLAKSQPYVDETVCQICYVGLYEQQFLPLQKCQHIFHKNCLSQYFKAQISQNRFPLKCPNDTCKLQVTDADIKQILAEQLYSKYQKNTLKHYADMHGDSISWCPTADCQYMFFFEKDDNVRFQCLQCKKQYCLNCRCDWHKEMTCKQYQVSNTHNADDDAFMKFVTGKKFKQCPKCKFWVEKNQGCDHMTCKCKFQFCYKCGGVYMKCQCMAKAQAEMQRRRQMIEQRRRKKAEAAQRKKSKSKAKAPPPPPPSQRSRRNRR